MTDKAAVIREIAATIAINLVRKERKRQDEKWGEQNLPPLAWVSILGEEFGEFCEAVNETVFENGAHKEKGGYENMVKELTHVAATATAALECLLRKEKGIYNDRL